MTTRRNEEFRWLEKFCPKCQEWWPADPEFFYADRSSKDGLFQWCKACYMDYRHSRRPPGAVRRLLPKEDARVRSREIVELKSQGLTFEVIGCNFNITRQRVQQIYAKEMKRRVR